MNDASTAASALRLQIQEDEANENLEKQTVKISGYSAKCFLHEWDHLQGVTFKDRVSKLKWDMANKKARKLRRNV